MSEGVAASVYAIVLAAGASTRFGSPKQCARLGGETLIRRAIAAASEAVGPAIRVVLGAYAADIGATLNLQPDQMVINTVWAEGIGSSIRAGVSRLPATCAGTLCLLADQPFVTGVTLGRLIDTWHSAPEHIVASRFGTVIGAPCLFPRWCFNDLESLHGDQGARGVLVRHSKRVLAVDHPEAGIDIDTPQQLAAQQTSIDTMPTNIRCRSGN